MDRGGKRGRSPNRRYTARGYRRENTRGNYYQWRPNWHNHYNNLYSYPYPVKPPSPLPGTEEYRQRNIQQTSELIKKQLNIDGNTCNNTELPLESNLIVEEDQAQSKEATPPASTPCEQKKMKTKKSQVENDEEIDVQEIYDKIVKHISNLSYSKKLNLINQGNSGYDIAIEQIQKQKQLELSKALRDMSQRPVQDTDEEVIQSIIPDIGIKLEDLPNNVIEELSKTLQVKFKNDPIEFEATENHVVDMNISSKSEIENNDFNHTREPCQNVIDNIFDFEYLNETEMYEDPISAPKNTCDSEEHSTFSIANIDVTKSYLELIELPRNLENKPCKEEKPDSDLLHKSGCGTIRVKKDIFEIPEKDKGDTTLILKDKENDSEVIQEVVNQSNTPLVNASISTPNTINSNSAHKTSVTALSEEESGLMAVCKTENLDDTIPLQESLTNPDISTFDVIDKNSNSTTNIPKSKSCSPSFEQQNQNSLISPSHIINENSNSNINMESNKKYPSPFRQQSGSTSISPNFIEASTSNSNNSNSSSIFRKGQDVQNLNSEKGEVRTPFFSIVKENSNETSSTPNSRLTLSPFDRQNIQIHISPLLRDLQTPPLQLSTETSTPKKWKSPGEKKMIPFENNEYMLETTINLNTKSVDEQQINKNEANTSDKAATSNKSAQDKIRERKEKKSKKKKPDIHESISNDATKTNSQSTAISKERDNKRCDFEFQNSRISRDVSTMVNFESKHKRRRKIDVLTQTDNSGEIESKFKESKEVTTMTESIKLITISSQTPIKFFRKNLQAKSVQTVPTITKNVDIQATERTKCVSVQTEKPIEDTRKKYMEYLTHMKLMQEIDQQIKELLLKKNSLYQHFASLNPEVNNKDKKKRNKKTKSEKDGENTSEVVIQNISEKSNKEVIKDDSIKTSENSLVEDKSKVIGEKSEEDNKMDEGGDFRDKIKVQKSEIREIKNLNQTQKPQIEKDKQPKPPVHSLKQMKEGDSKSENLERSKLPKYPVKDTKEIDNKPLKISLKVEKDENNIKTYTLKRGRSRSSSNDKEPKPKKPTLPNPSDKDYDTPNAVQQSGKRFKVSKEFENMIYGDNKFMKKCCVKIEPLATTEKSKDSELEKTNKSIEEEGKFPRVSIGKELNTSRESAGSPHSLIKQKSKVIDKLEFKGLEGSIFSLKVVDDDLLAAGDNGTLYIFNVVTQELINSVSLSAQALTCVHVLKLNNECLIYVTCLDGNLRIVDHANKKIQRTINIGHGIQCMDIAWDYVFLGSITGQLDIFSIKEEKLEDSIDIFDNRIYAIKATQEGARRVLLMGAKDAELSIRDAMTGLLMRTVQTRYSPTIYSILSDQSLIYCGTNQHDVLVYSFQDGELVKRYEGIASRRVICMQIVDNLVFVGCFNGSVCVFHKGTHQYLGHMIRPGESLLSMVIVKNKVIVGLKNNKLVSWDVPVVYLEKNR